ncbi:hypothetical protein PR002_g1724 [Phytophthora rubi]|uniref:Secreted protein n=1 Tax=Phytophthora rubi TaxID=129364 RepID=A0A6A3NSR9_9STRA|nr:hypothetical protein PR002_g1724 [Phytophthora rubi]
MCNILVVSYLHLVSALRVGCAPVAIRARWSTGHTIPSSSRSNALIPSYGRSTAVCRVRRTYPIQPTKTQASQESLVFFA